MFSFQSIKISIFKEFLARKCRYQEDLLVNDLQLLSCQKFQQLSIQPHSTIISLRFSLFPIESQDTPILVKAQNLLPKCYVYFENVTVSNCYASDELPPIYMYATGQQITQQSAPTGNALIQIRYSTFNGTITASDAIPDKWKDKTKQELCKLSDHAAFIYTGLLIVNFDQTTFYGLEDSAMLISGYTEVYINVFSKFQNNGLRKGSEFDWLQTNIICKKSQYQSRDRQTVVHIPSKAIPDFSETYNTWIYAKDEDQCVFDLTLDDKKQLIAQKFIINQMKFEFTGELQDFVQLNIEGNGFNPCTDNYTLIFRDRSNSEIQFAPIIFDQKTLITIQYETQQKFTITFPSYLTPQFPHTEQPHSLDTIDTALVQAGNEQDINWLQVDLYYPPIDPIPIPDPDPTDDPGKDKGDQIDEKKAGLSTGAIIGFVAAIVVLAIVAVVFIVMYFVFVYRQKKKENNNNNYISNNNNDLQIIELSNVSVRSERDDQQKSDERSNTGDNAYQIDEQRQVRVSQGIFVHQSQRGSHLNEKDKKQEQQNKGQIIYDENQQAERSVSTAGSDNDNAVILSQKKEEEQEIPETQGSQRKSMNDLKRRIAKKDKKVNSKTRKGAKNNMKQKQMLQSQEDSSNVLLQTSKRGHNSSDKNNKKEQNEIKKRKDKKTVKSIENDDGSSSAASSSSSSQSIKSSSQQSSQSAISVDLQSLEIVAPRTHAHDKYETEDDYSLNENQNEQSSSQSQQYHEEEFGRLSELPVEKDWKNLKKSVKKQQEKNKEKEKSKKVKQQIKKRNKDQRNSDSDSESNSSQYSSNSSSYSSYSSSSSSSESSESENVVKPLDKSNRKSLKSQTLSEKKKEEQKISKVKGKGKEKTDKKQARIKDSKEKKAEKPNVYKEQEQEQSNKDKLLAINKAESKLAEKGQQQQLKEGDEGYVWMNDDHFAGAEQLSLSGMESTREGTVDARPDSPSVNLIKSSSNNKMGTTQLPQDQDKPSS
ncbi:MAG: hypothetical protein EZS28_014413 [Streblomastix strix]|uniref:Transmembrane protein n=1 Tax=Streblomastix strix TaxID=222440 RepID=A0A5J4W6G8_9EUKA|nr:MAG: hypothetical protein EZS28_014413 [Streblomastix strix]